MFLKKRPNIGILNALIRITCGLTILAWCMAKLTRRPNKPKYLFVAMLSAMKVGEGILKYCPATDALQSAVEKSFQADGPPLNKVMDYIAPKEEDGGPIEEHS